MEDVRPKLEELREKKKATILAIESSCDETAAAIVQDGRTVLASDLYSQIAIHAEYGGVVPELASRNHVGKLPYMVDSVLKKAEMELEDVDAIGVTYGPGLVGALLTGVAYAKGLAFAKAKPLIPVNHIEGHICANYITYPELKPPFLCLVVSGGHSHIVLVEDYGAYRLLGCTRDDAAGEAFDKIARVLGMPYPGGPNLEKMARQGDANAYPMPKSFKGETHLDFSFSGLKTAVMNLVHKMDQQGVTYRKEDVAASFQKAVVTALVDNTFEAARRAGVKQVAIAGGVSANGALREAARRRAEKQGLAFYLPQMEYCTDNAAMIGSAAFYRMLAGQQADLSLNACPSLKLV